MEWGAWVVVLGGKGLKRNIYFVGHLVKKICRGEEWGFAFVERDFEGLLSEGIFHSGMLRFILERRLCQKNSWEPVFQSKGRVPILKSGGQFRKKLCEERWLTVGILRYLK